MLDRCRLGTVLDDRRGRGRGLGRCVVRNRGRLFAPRLRRIGLMLCLGLFALLLQAMLLELLRIDRLVRALVLFWTALAAVAAITAVTPAATAAPAAPAAMLLALLAWLLAVRLSVLLRMG